MMKKNEKLLSFATGFAGYPLLELLWRGHTHWSMAFAGGLALLILYPLSKNSKYFCLKAMVVISAIELIFGIFFNIIWKKNVWDYSKQPLNILGQICLPYCLLWFALGLPIRWLCNGLRRLLD